MQPYLPLALALSEEMLVILVNWVGPVMQKGEGRSKWQDGSSKTTNVTNWSDLSITSYRCCKYFFPFLGRFKISQKNPTGFCSRAFFSPFLFFLPNNQQRLEFQPLTVVLFSQRLPCLLCGGFGFPKNVDDSSGGRTNNDKKSTPKLVSVSGCSSAVKYSPHNCEANGSSAGLFSVERL